MNAKDREWVIADATRAGMTFEDARRIARLASTLDRLNEAECNGDYPCDNGERKVIACSRCEAGYVPSHVRSGLCDSCRAQDRVSKIAARYGATVTFNGDPRGYPLTLEAQEVSR